MKKVIIAILFATLSPFIFAEDSAPTEQSQGFSVGALIGKGAGFLVRQATGFTKDLKTGYRQQTGQEAKADNPQVETPPADVAVKAQSEMDAGTAERIRFAQGRIFIPTFGNLVKMLKGDDKAKETETVKAETASEKADN